MINAFIKKKERPQIISHPQGIRRMDQPKAHKEREIRKIKVEERKIKKKKKKDQRPRKMKRSRLKNLVFDDRQKWRTFKLQ